MASCDVDGDGTDEIVVGEGSAHKDSAYVRIFRSDGTMTGGFDVDGNFRYGVNVGCIASGGNGISEIVTGEGPHPENRPVVRIFRYGEKVDEFRVFDKKYGYGVKVTGGAMSRDYPADP